ncbi:MAG: TIR domain-containing protein [Williamsia sp.]|nr:TIR domain-containing protein [Williamsia sp.]
MQLESNTTIEELLDNKLISQAVYTVCVREELFDMGAISRYESRFKNFLRIKGCGKHTNKILLSLCQQWASVPDEKKALSLKADTEETVFINYCRSDKNYVSTLATWLQGHGVKVWFDHYTDYGEKWEADIEDKLYSSVAVLVVMSKAAQQSAWVHKEIKMAKQKEIAIYPLLLEADGMVDMVSDLQIENVTGRQMPGLRLCQKLPDFLVTEQDIANALTPAQRKLADRIFHITGMLQYGSKGVEVAALQMELLRVGLDPGAINGAFGKKTRAAVIKFQTQRCHIPVADGKVGALTWMILIHSSLGDLANSL